MNENSPFFSIIMPVFNSEKYLEVAVTSVLNQTYKNFELILVNDCSTDSSADICNYLSKKDPRIIYLKTPHNAGASVARNLALKKARGDYLGFVDSDDIIDKELLEKVYPYLKDGKYECLKFGCIEEYYAKDNSLKYTKICTMSDGEYKFGTELSAQIVELEMIPLFGYACNGFYSKAVADKYEVYFDDKFKVNEDFDFNIRFFEYVKWFKFLSFPAYHYAKRIGSSLTGQEKNYNYSVQMMKIQKLIGLYPKVDAIPAHIRSKIFWLYTRFVYALLIRAKRVGEFSSMWSRIREDTLYEYFYNTQFIGMNAKQQEMIDLLRQGEGIKFRILLELIYLAKTYLPVLFAMVKK